MAAARPSPQTFEETGLCRWLTRQVQTLGIQCPTEVQRACIPVTIRGGDVIGCAPTGSGKTAAFALPILHKLSEDPFGIFALVMTPTRELAFQIGEQFRAFGAPARVRCEVVVGGVDMMKQAEALSKRPHIVVSTPGRLADHISSTGVDGLSRVRVLVLDEADRLLSDDFGSEMGCILSALGHQRQTLLFSATMTKNLRTLKELSMEDAFCFEACTAGGEWAVVEQLHQQYVLMPAKVKDTYLVHLLRTFDSLSTIVFTASCKSCEILQALINGVGVESVALHSRMSQADRSRALSRFKSSRVRVLVATDVGSRGLDIPKVELVLNYNLPAAAKEYVHRVGRTARAGRAGRAIALVTQYDVELVLKIESAVGKKLELLALQEEEVLEHFKEVLVAKRIARINIAEKAILSNPKKYRKRKANWATKVSVQEIAH